MTGEIEVLQDVAVLDVAVEGRDLLVDVYGSLANACGTVRLTIPEADRRATAARTLERWSGQDTPLTLVRNGDRVSLQHTHATFAAQLRPHAG